MPLSSKNIISAQVITYKSERLMKKVLKDAKKRIRKGELIDSHSFALYLQTIDARFTPLKSDINNATRVIDYAKVRAEKMAETRQLLDFFSQDHDELNRLHQIVVQKAKEAERISDLRQENLSPVDISKLKDAFEKLSRKDDENE